MNPLIIYVGHEILHTYLPVQWRPANITHGTLMAMNVWGPTFWVLVAWYLHINGTYFSL